MVLTVNTIRVKSKATLPNIIYPDHMISVVFNVQLYLYCIVLAYVYNLILQ